MLPNPVRKTIEQHFEEEINAGKKNVYFSQFHSSRSLTIENTQEIFSKELGVETPNISGSDQKGIIIEINETPIFLWDIGEERWLFAYSSSLNRRLRDKLDSLANKVGWLLDVWIPGEIVNELFHEHSPDQESVNIERRWDPYWIYERGGEIPESLQSYYNQNYENFVEQEIEFSLKTPKALVDKTLKEGVREDLLEKSEISESKFTYQSDEGILLQDGGVQVDAGNSPRSRVTVRQRGQVVHSTGEAEATFDLLDDIDKRENHFEKFEEAVPNREYEKREDGSLKLKSYSPGKTLRFSFTEKPYNQEASIKLSNLLTVGQSDVDIHGTVNYWKDLEFFASSYTSYDDGEYEVYFTQEDYMPTLYIKPLAGKVSGLIYIYRKLKEKFDPRIEVEFVQSFPSMEE